MKSAFKWTTAIAFTGIVFVLGLYMKHHKSATTLAHSAFKFDAEHGFVVTIPQQVRFMGLPMFLAITSQGKPTTTDLGRATKAMAELGQCIPTAEARLAEYAKPNTITAADIQSPHIWIDPEEQDQSRWTIVVEAKDNDGYAWHIEFAGTEFHNIWAGS